MCAGRRFVKAKIGFLVPSLIILSVAVAVTLTTTPSFLLKQHDEAGFNFIFMYGCGLVPNELNTFNGTFTRDMVCDPPVSTDLSLTKEEMAMIYQKMVEIDFFSYPENLSYEAHDGMIAMVTPCSSYYLKVKCNSTVKELSWNENLILNNPDAVKLGELSDLIIGVIQSHEEFKQMPGPGGVYI